MDQFAIPGDATFPLNQAFEAPRDRQDAEVLRQQVHSRIISNADHSYECSRYLSQVRQELAMRLLARVYADGNTPSKVSVAINPLRNELNTDDAIVVVEFHEA